MLCTTTRKILFVDDDKSILAAIKRQLKSQFDVSTVDDPQKALQLLRRSGPYPVIVSDLEMSGMSGIEFLAQARQLYPQTVCILATGHSDLNIGAEATNKGLVFRFLAKPVTAEKLFSTLEDAFAQHERLMSVGRYTYSVYVTNGRPVHTEYHDNCVLVTGYTADEFEKNTLLWISIVMPEFRNAVIEFADSVLSDRKSGCIEYQIRRKDGEIRWLRDTIITHFDARQMLVRYDGLIEDITEQRKADADLREKTRLSRALVDSLPCRAMLVDERTSEIVVANQMAIQAGAVPGRKCFTSWQGGSQQCPWCKSGQISGDASPVQAELKIDGRWWQLHWIPVANELFLHCAFDITSHRQTQQKLIEAEEKLRSYEASDGRRLEQVAAELRTPLSAVRDIVANAVAGKMGEMHPRLRESLGVAESKLERLAKTLNELSQTTQ
ncbi:MAG TPA: response regulator [Sedimentisphaerales bacterium]|nr:response regulator [Sedimentisphaerales bacterium]